MGSKDWTDEDERKPNVTERDKEVLKDEKPFQVKMYGTTDHTTIEAMIIGNMVKDDQDNSKIEEVIESGITKDSFETPELKGVFQDLISYHKKWNLAPTVDEMSIVCQNNSQTNDEATNFRHVLQTCLGTVIARKMNIKLVLERFIQHTSSKTNDRNWKEYLKERVDPTIGEEDATRRLAEKLNRNKVKANKLPKPYDASAFLGENLPVQKEELWEGIVRKGAKLFIGGQSKTHKTFCLQGLAVALANGLPYWGAKTKKSKSLYINLELTDADFQRRIDVICKNLGIIPNNSVKVWGLRGQAMSLELLVPEIIALSNKEKELTGTAFGAIFIDPVYKCLGARNENDSGDMNDFCNELGKIAHETDSTVICALHFAKGNASGKDALDRISGSGVFGRDPDAVINLTPHETDGCFVASYTLRSFAPKPEVGLRWEWPLMSLDETLNPKALKGLVGKGQPVSVDDVLLASPSSTEAPISKDRIIENVKEETGAGTSRIYTLFKECVDKGYFNQSSKKRSGTNDEKLFKLSNEGERKVAGKNPIPKITLNNDLDVPLEGIKY